MNYVSEYARKYPAAACEELAQVGGFGSVSTMKRAMNKWNEGKSVCNR